ncbi:MAG TPA: hypothetical protein DE036_07240 [Actinobacteria bacterium]|nr:hypothetical protein [Actinomycetota bacterium]
MSFQEAIQFMQENPTCTLATADGDQPRARGMLVLWAREDGIYFTTGAPKSLYTQLRANPKVELCFYTPQPLKALRVTGEVKFVDDIALKSQALEERPFLKAFGSGTAGDPNFIIFKVANGEAFFWTMEDNLSEAEIPRIYF